MASARPAGQTRLAYGERRAELVRAAIRVVADHGIAGLSHRAVAAEAGVTHGLVRHHFGTMTALIAEALDTILPESLVVNPVTLLLDAPHVTTNELVAWIDDQEDLQVFEYEVLLAARHIPELRPLALRMYEGYEASVRAAFVEHGMPEPPQASVALIVAAIEGLVLHRVTFRRHDGAPIAGAFAALRSAVLADLAKSIPSS